MILRCRTHYHVQTPVWIVVDIVFSSIVLAHSVRRQLERIRSYGLYWPHTRQRLWWTLVSLIVIAILDALALIFVGIVTWSDYNPAPNQNYSRFTAYLGGEGGASYLRLYRTFVAFSALWMYVTL